MISLSLVTLLSLATWRLSSLLVNEPGPLDIFERLRVWLGVKYDEHSIAYGTNVVSKAFCCVWCLSLWISPVFAIATGWKEEIPIVVCLWLGSSAGAILVQEIIEALSTHA
jgi:hypothetical protein